MEILSIGHKIRKLREEKNMSLSKLGGDFVSKAHLSYIENGKVSPSIEVLAYIAKALGVDLECLLETERMQAERQCYIWLKEMSIHSRIGEIKEAYKIDDDINVLANKYEILDAKGESNYIMGQAYIILKDYNQAVGYLEKSIYYSSKNDNIHRIIQCYIKQGNAYLNMSLYETAVQKYRQANEFHNQLNYKDMELESNIMYNLSTCYHRMKDKEKSIKYAEEVCKIDEELNDKKRYAQSLLKYAATFILNKEYTKAREILSKANKILDTEDNSITRAHIENNLGLIYLEEDYFEKAFNHLTKAKEMKEELNLDDLPNTLYELYKYYLKMGEEDKALEELTKAVDFSRKRKLKNYEIRGLNYYIDYYLDRKKYNEALVAFKKLISILETTEMKKELLDTYLKLGKLHTNIGNDKEAISCLTKAYCINQDLI